MSRDVVRWRENLRQIDLKAQLKLAEEKLAEFNIEWDGDKYVFTPTQTSTRPTFSISEWEGLLGVIRISINRHGLDTVRQAVEYLAKNEHCKACGPCCPYHHAAHRDEANEKRIDTCGG